MGTDWANKMYGSTYHSALKAVRDTGVLSMARALSRDPTIAVIQQAIKARTAVEESCLKSHLAINQSVADIVGLRALAETNPGLTAISSFASIYKEWGTGVHQQLLDVAAISGIPNELVKTINYQTKSVVNCGQIQHNFDWCIS